MCYPDRRGRCFLGRSLDLLQKAGAGGNHNGRTLKERYIILPSRSSLLTPEKFSLGENFFHHVSVHVGEAVIAPLELVSVLFVVEAEQV